MFRRMSTTINATGTAAISNSAIAGRVASAMPPESPASTASYFVGQRIKRPAMSSMSVKKNRKKVSVRICELVTINVNENAARMPATKPTRGDTKAPSAAMSTHVPESITA